MRYTQTLRILNGLKWFSVVAVAFYAVVVGIAALTGFFGHVQHITDKNFNIPLPALFALASLVTCFFVTRFGRTLALENDEHLPLVWTRPSSRSRTALTVLGVDALGILAAFAIWMVLAFALVATFRVSQYVIVPGDAFVQLLRYLALPFAFYAVLMALTASVEGGGAMCGWAWVGAIFLTVLAASPFIPNPWHAVFNFIDFINPLAYGSFHSQTGSDTINVIGGPTPTYVAGLTPAMDVVGLTILFAIGLAAGLIQWRRLEA